MKKFILLIQLAATMIFANPLLEQAEDARLDGDYHKAVQLFTKVCDDGSADGCSNLGYAYINGRGVKKDPSKGALFYKKSIQLDTKACENGSAKACNSMGLSYQYGTNGLKKDNLKTVQYYQKACDGGYALACITLASIYSHGDIVRQSNKKAKELYGKACDLGEELGCKGYKLY